MKFFDYTTIQPFALINVHHIQPLISHVIADVIYRILYLIKLIKQAEQNETWHSTSISCSLIDLLGPSLSLSHYSPGRDFF